MRSASESSGFFSMSILMTLALSPRAAATLRNTAFIASVSSFQLVKKLTSARKEYITTNTSNYASLRGLFLKVITVISGHIPALPE